MTVKKASTKKKCAHKLEAPKVLRFNNAIHERGECAKCGAFGEYVTKVKDGSEYTEWWSL